jgi:hypothetical protein
VHLIIRRAAARLFLSALCELPDTVHVEGGHTSK